MPRTLRDTLVHAWAKQERYYGGNARGWLCTVLHNVHVSKIRRVSAETRIVEIHPAAVDNLLVDTAAIFRLVVRDVARELRTMPEGMRPAVMLAAVSNDDYYGMAARLNVNLGTFRSRLSRGWQRLPTQLTATSCPCLLSEMA